MYFTRNNNKKTLKINKIFKNKENLSIAIKSISIREQNPGRTKKRLERFKSLRQIVEQYSDLPIKTHLDAIVAHYNCDWDALMMDGSFSSLVKNTVADIVQK